MRTLCITPVIAASFGKKLIDQPPMRSVLADLALESEAMTALSLRLRAQLRPLQRPTPTEAGYARLVTPAAKFGICKAAPRLLYEAMECLGGNGYVEESALPRLYREAPVNAIWEGSGNVIALDILRTETREPEVAAAVARGTDGPNRGTFPAPREAAGDISWRSFGQTLSRRGPASSPNGCSRWPRPRLSPAPLRLKSPRHGPLPASPPHPG